VTRIFPPTKIYIAESKIPKSGRGVFAASDIKKGEIIEEAPILVLKFEDFIDTRWNLLFEYYFWMDKFVVLCLGYGSLYNHSTQSNCQYKISKEEKLIRFTAIKYIKKDEEICFNYKGSSTSKTPLWFERK
jgi:uncharacterized protein